MSTSEEYTQEKLFDRYLAKEMEEDERMAFESRLDTEPELKATFASFLQGKQISYLLGYKSEKALFEEKLKEINRQKQRSRVLRVALISVAAAFILLMAFIFLPFSSPTPVSPADLYASYYEPPAPKAQMGSQTDSLQRTADFQFSQKAYGQAAALYETYLETQDFNAFEASYTRLMLGISYLETDQFEKARQALSLADQHKQQAEWYAALSWLKEGKNKEAITAFTQIKSQNGHFHQSHAQAILEKLAGD